MSILVHSGAIPVHSRSIPVHSCSFLRILVPFLRTPADSSGMGSFLQESVGHGEVLVVMWVGASPWFVGGGTDDHGRWVVLDGLWKVFVIFQCQSRWGHC